MYRALQHNQKRNFSMFNYLKCYVSLAAFYYTMVHNPPLLYNSGSIYTRKNTSSARTILQNRQRYFVWMLSKYISNLLYIYKYIHICILIIPHNKFQRIKWFPKISIKCQKPRCLGAIQCRRWIPKTRKNIRKTATFTWLFTTTYLREAFIKN